jgi:uncharacterized protein YhaN
MAFKTSKTKVAVITAVFLAGMGLLANSFLKTGERLVDATRILDAYQDYRKTQSEESLAELHGYLPSYALATVLSSSIDVAKGDLAHRDHVLMESLKNLPDPELYMALYGDRLVFSEKDQLIEREWMAKANIKATQQDLDKRFATTLAKDDLSTLNKCYALLQLKYQENPDQGDARAIGADFGKYLNIVAADTFGYSYSCKNLR